MSWSKLHKRMLPYIVRIETQDGSGTGFLFGYNETKTITAIATAAHVIDNAHDWNQPIKITHYESGKQIFITDTDRVVFIDKTRDSASVLLWTNQLSFPKDTLPLIEADKFKKVGVELAWMGFPSVAHPELCFFTGRVSAFLPKEDSYLIDGVAINGVSGGPVFYELDDSTPQLVGLISAYLPNRVSGTTLPGLLRAQDITSFQKTLQTIKSLDEARDMEKEESKEAPPPEPPGEA